MRWTWMPALAAAAGLALAPAARAQTPLNAPSITSPHDGDRLRDAHVVVAGTADPLAHVVVADSAGPGAATDADVQGAWSLELTAGEGAHTLTAHEEALGVDSADSAPVNVTVDTIAPAAPQIAEPADGALLKGPVVQVHGSAEDGASVEVREGATLLQTVTASGGVWSANLGLGDGAHTLGAVARDAAGNASPPSTVQVTVDSVPPKTAIDSGPHGLTNAPAAAFTVSADESAATFACSLTRPDGSGAFAPCDRQVSYDLPADGRYTFTAVASDAAGNADPQPPTRTFTVDRTPPGPPALSGLSFSSEEDGATFQCALDGSAYAPCSSPVAAAGLAPGAHTVLVRAIDRAGNTGAPAALRFAVALPLPGHPAAPAAAFHSAVVVRPTAGTVRVRRKGATAYTELKAALALPLGSTVDAKRGAVALSSVPRKLAAAQRATFTGGIFRVTQPGRATVLTLTERLACGRTGKPKSRRLAGEGAGAFRIRGRYSSAAAGDRWVVRDTCSGTLTRALQGLVAVRDDVRHKTVLVRAGKRYLARPRH